MKMSAVGSIWSDRSTWGTDPFSLGAYSHVLPGRSGARRKMAEPVEDRIFFAGEACHPKWATQVTGAYLSALEAADAVVEEIT